MDSSSSRFGTQRQEVLSDSHMLNALPVAVCVLNDQAVIQKANREFSIISGLPSAKLSGVSLLSLVGEPCHHKILAMIAREHVPESDDRILSIQFRFGAGPLSWGNMKIGRINPESNTRNYICTLEKADGIVSGKKNPEENRIEHQLKESEARFRSVAEALTPRIFHLDIDGVITYANRFKGRVIKGNFLGQSIYKFLTNEENVQRLQSALNACKAKRHPVSFQVNHQFDTHPGETRYYLIQLSPVLTNDVVTGFAMIRTDITSIKTVQQELEKTNSKLSSIVSGIEATGIGVFEWDILDGEKVVWDENTHHIFGMETGDFDGTKKGFEKMIFPEDAEAVKEEILFAVEHLQQQNTSHRIVRADTGEMRWVSTRRIITRNKEGRPISMTGVLWDITDEKEKEELKLQAALLKNQNQELKEFTYIASHDLQSPLRTLSNYVKLLEEDPKSDIGEDAKWYLSVIQGSVVRMKDLIHDLLTYSRIGRHREKGEVNLQVILEGVMNDLNLEIMSAEAKIEIGTLPTLPLYETEIRLLFQNLLSNAIKYRKPDVTPIISVIAKESQNSWSITVSDNGIGIESKYFEKIFMVFQRLHDQTEFEGNGIGLAHCRKIVQLHEGTIVVESEAGVGSSFTIELPK